MHLRRVDPAAPVRARWAALIAVGAGLASLLAFPRFGVWPLAFVSVASFSVAVQGRRARTAAWLGLVYGAAFFVPLLHWTGVYVGPAPWLILAIAEAGYFAGMGAVLSCVQRLPFAPLWIGATWVLQEAIRDWNPFGGFPWGRLAFSQADSPMRWLAPLGGAPLVTFGVAVGGGALARLILSANIRAWRATAISASALAAVPLVCLLLGVALQPPPDAHGRTTTIAVVQGSVPDRGLGFEDRRRQVLDNHVAETMKLAAAIRAGTQPRQRYRARSVRSACRFWSARSWTVPVRITTATWASCGRRPRAPAPRTQSGIRCPSASTCRCVASRRPSAPRPAWSSATWWPATATAGCVAGRSRSAT